MNELELKSNSNKEKKTAKVVKNDVAIRKNPGKKLTEAFIAEDGATVKTYLVWDVIIPALKDTLADVVKKGIDTLLYGSSKPTNVQRNGGTSYVSYSSYSSRRQDPPFQPDPSYRRAPAYQRRAAHDFSDVVMRTRSDAEEVLSQLVEITMQYGATSVADFYELVGVDSAYTDNKYGWEELSDARVLQVRGGYILDLPRPIALER